MGKLDVNGKKGLGRKMLRHRISTDELRHKLCQTRGPDEYTVEYLLEQTGV
jgi:hypothetical protein